jgi:hypothetical protein
MNRLLVLFVCLLVLVACQQTPKPNSKTLGFLELPISNVLTQAAVLPDTALSFVPLAAVAVCDDMTKGLRYLQRSFRFTNNTSATLNNLVLHAYKKIGNADGTALKAIVNFGGAISPNPRAVVPSHGMDCNAGTVDSKAADLQLFNQTEINSRVSEAGTALWVGEYPLGFGYLMQQRLGDTNADSNPRTIAPNETAIVTIALSVPNQTSGTYGFSLTFLLSEGGVNELVQSLEEQITGTVAGLSAVPSGTRKVTMLGGQACGASSTDLKFVDDLRVAGKQGGTGSDAVSTHLTVPAVTTIVSGSLSNAVANAIDGDGICFETTIGVSSPLIINKSIGLYGGANVSLTGSFSSRVLETTGTGKTVVLGGFTIKDGRLTHNNSNFGGAGILVDTTTRLIGMKVTSNQVKGAIAVIGLPDTFLLARGGGIFSTINGILSIEHSQISSNTVTGTSGVNGLLGIAGQNGGHAYGAGIYSAATSSSALKIVASRIENNTAQGGFGGRGFDSVSTPTQCLVQATNGGNGGDAIGGGIYSLASGNTVFSASNNTVIAGLLGNFGAPGGVCPPAQMGSMGAATNANSYP